MTRIVYFILLFGFLTLAGCGGGQPPLNTTPLTEEQKQKVKAEDQRIEDEERGGSGTATKTPRR